LSQETTNQCFAEKPGGYQTRCSKQHEKKIPPVILQPAFINRKAYPDFYHDVGKAYPGHRSPQKTGRVRQVQELKADNPAIRKML